nr:thioesterase [uncultured bacterium]
MRLFCFPYAGGLASIYHTWPQFLPENVELYAAQLPGRGSRTKEPSFTNIQPLVEAIVPAIRPHLDKPFAFFGHSMGALISFELAHKLRQQYDIEPVHLFISGCRPPQFRIIDNDAYKLPDPEFIEELRRLNGTPKEVLEHAELMELIIPILRADFEICQTYASTPKSQLSCPMTIFGGLQDIDVSRQYLEGWGEYTTAPSSLRMLPGDHFFLHSAERTLLQQVYIGLQQVSARLKGS